MLKSITFNSNFRKFTKGQIFTLKKGLNLLVGDNGSGKSSLLEVIFGKKIAGKKIDVTVKTDEYNDCYYLDLEHGNPRTKGRIETLSQIASIFHSHGESNNSILRTISKLEDNVTVLVDEPDLALSIKSIKKLSKFLRNESTTKQIICAVHNPLLISSVSQVLSLDHFKWVSSKDYLEE